MNNIDENKQPPLKPPFYFLIGIAIIALSSFVNPVVKIPFIYPNAAMCFGGVLVILGVVLVAWAMNIVKLAGTSYNFQKPTKLLVDGPYKYSRNPMYVALILMLLGGAIAVNAIFALIAPIMMFTVLDRIFIPYEEDLLQQTFRHDYLRYKAKVGVGLSYNFYFLFKTPHMIVGCFFALFLKE